MGKGRNNRRRKRRKEQSRKSKREHKKQKQAQEAKWKNQPNPTPKNRKRKRNKGNKMSMHNYSRDVQCVHLGMSGRFLIESKYSEYLSQFKQWYDEGVLTEISFLICGKWNAKTRKRLCGLVKSNGHEWAINHILFRNPEEFDASFMLKRARCLKMTHYVDMNKDNISTFVMSNMYGRLKLFYWDEDPVRGWEDFKSWLKENNPEHYNLWEQGEQAAQIIQTGVHAERKFETFISEGYSGDDNEWIPEILEAT